MTSWTTSPRRRLAAGIGTLAALISVTTAQPASAGPQPDCQRIDTAVSVGPGEPADQHIAATLCLPRHRTGTVQLLVPGGFYGQSYWYLHGDPHGPSYVDAMTRAGYATLSIDRLGTGGSAHPPSQQFQTNTHREVTHQIVRQLRAGRLGGQRFDRVVLVGHSLSSAIAQAVAIEHPEDADGVILTGAATRQNEASFEAMSADVHRANQDPQFAALGLDDGYATTRPGMRQRWFYHLPTADPAVIAADEATKQPDVIPGYDAFPPPSKDKPIRVPVLVVVGQQDVLMCGGTGSDCSSSAALLAQERPAYPAPASVEAAVIPDTGHSLNLHRTAPVWFGVARDWIDRHIGRSA